MRSLLTLRVAVLTLSSTLGVACSQVVDGPEDPLRGGDAGQADAGQADAGQIDAGLTDAGQIDAGLTDAGLLDAGISGDGADAGQPGAFGDPCPVWSSAGCLPGLLCLQGPAGGPVGFCTKRCSGNGACATPPPGTAAYCVVTNVDASGSKGCAFLCSGGGTGWRCPGDLSCSANDDPPGSGQRLCLP